MRCDWCFVGKIKIGLSEKHLETNHLVSNVKWRYALCGTYVHNDFRSVGVHFRSCSAKHPAILRKGKEEASNPKPILLTQKDVCVGYEGSGSQVVQCPVCQCRYEGTGAYAHLEKHCRHAHSCEHFAFGCERCKVFRSPALIAVRNH